MVIKQSDLASFYNISSKAAFDDKKKAINKDNKGYELNGEAVSVGEPDILYNSIVFIEETLEIWHGGKFYGNLDLNNSLPTVVLRSLKYEAGHELNPDNPEEYITLYEYSFDDINDENVKLLNKEGFDKIYELWPYVNVILITEPTYMFSGMGRYYANYKEMVNLNYAVSGRFKNDIGGFINPTNRSFVLSGVCYTLDNILKTYTATYKSDYIQTGETTWEWITDMTLTVNESKPVLSEFTSLTITGDELSVKCASTDISGNTLSINNSLTSITAEEFLYTSNTLLLNQRTIFRTQPNGILLQTPAAINLIALENTGNGATPYIKLQSDDISVEADQVRVNAPILQLYEIQKLGQATVTYNTTYCIFNFSNTINNTKVEITLINDTVSTTKGSLKIIFERYGDTFILSFNLSTAMTLINNIYIDYYGIYVLNKQSYSGSITVKYKLISNYPNNTTFTQRSLTSDSNKILNVASYMGQSSLQDLNPDVVYSITGYCNWL